jgi:protocatechuate 3,4-dioxygenase beta subunit
MLTHKTTLTAVLLIALCVLGTGLAVWARPVAQKPPEQPAPRKSAPPAPKPDSKALEVGGRVLGPDGKAVKGAKVYLLNHWGLGLSGAARASSDAEGCFHFRVARSDFEGSIMRAAHPWDGATVVAVADGYGVGLPAKHGLSKGLTLRLVKDFPLTGRILDLQGKPLPGITVRLAGLYGSAKGDLSAFVAAVRQGQELFPAMNEGLIGFGSPLPADWGRDRGPLPTAVVSGADGRFTIKGIGRERVVHLSVEGPAIVVRDFYAMTRPGDTLRVPGYKMYLPRTDMLTIYSDGFSHVAAPCKVITGVVRDKDTGKPIPGALVTSYKRAGSHISAVTDLRAVADKDGRYRLTGMPKGQGNVIRAAPPRGEPYLMSIREVADTPGLKPVQVDFVLKRGVWLRGRVLDQRTRRPLHAAVEYVVFADNSHRREAPGLEVEIYLQSNPRDGTFETVALPGRGLVAARAWNDRYCSRLGAAGIKGMLPDGHFNTEPHLLHPNHFHRLVEVNPAADAREVTCDLLLDSGRTLTGTVQGPDGKPLAGVRVSGLRTYGGHGTWENPLTGSDFVVAGLAEGEKRLLQFIHPDNKLAGHLLLKGNEKGPLTVRLAAAATLRGRLVTPEGEPVSDGRLISPLSSADGQLLGDVHPGKDGKFRIEGLVPGLTYRLGLSRAGYFHRLGGAAAGALILKPGEAKDLGDVVVKPIK